MIEKQAISDLRGEIAHTLRALAASATDYDRFKREEYSQLGRRRLTAVYIADSLDTFYTCLETLFFRIAEMLRDLVVGHHGSISCCVRRAPYARMNGVSTTLARILLPRTITSNLDPTAANVGGT